jgi:hypothetical protein
MSEVAKESGHWYYADGRTAYSIEGSNGKQRPATLRDARKLNLYPSVTRIVGMLDKPGLNNWIQDQVLMAALTLPRLEKESDDSYIARIKIDAKEKGRKAADRGTLLHGDIEKSIRGEPHGHQEHVKKVNEAMLEKGMILSVGRAEHTFAHTDGFAGKTDWHHGNEVCDFKSKDRIQEGKKLAWDEQCIQLSAYSYGLGLEYPRCCNIFVGVDDCEVVVHEWSQEEISRGLEMFKLLLNLWQLKNNFTPK